MTNGAFGDVNRRGKKIRLMIQEWSYLPPDVMNLMDLIEIIIAPRAPPLFPQLAKSHAPSPGSYAPNGISAKDNAFPLRLDGALARTNMKRYRRRRDNAAGAGSTGRAHS